MLTRSHTRVGFHIPGRVSLSYPGGFLDTRPGFHWRLKCYAAYPGGFPHTRPGLLLNLENFWSWRVSFASHPAGFPHTRRDPTVIFHSNFPYPPISFKEDINSFRKKFWRHFFFSVWRVWYWRDLSYYLPWGIVNQHLDIVILIILKVLVSILISCSCLLLLSLNACFSIKFKIDFLHEFHCWTSC